MKKPKKPHSGKNRRQKGNGQARLTPEQRLSPDRPERVAEFPQAKAGVSGSSSQRGRRKPQPDEEERKRKLWERKQTEMEARRIAAQSRRAEQEHARKRKTRVVFGVSGTIMTVLVCSLAWHFA